MATPRQLSDMIYDSYIAVEYKLRYFINTLSDKHCPNRFGRCYINDLSLRLEVRFPRLWY